MYSENLHMKLNIQALLALLCAVVLASDIPITLGKVIFSEETLQHSSDWESELE